MTRQLPYPIISVPGTLLVTGNRTRLPGYRTVTSCSNLLTFKGLSRAEVHLVSGAFAGMFARRLHAAPKKTGIEPGEDANRSSGTLGYSSGFRENPYGRGSGEYSTPEQSPKAPEGRPCFLDARATRFRSLRNPAEYQRCRTPLPFPSGHLPPSKHNLAPGRVPHAQVFRVGPGRARMTYK